MNKAEELLQRLIAAYDKAMANHPTWKEKRDAEYAAMDVRREAQEYLASINHTPQDQ